MFTQELQSCAVSEPPVKNISSRKVNHLHRHQECQCLVNEQFSRIWSELASARPERPFCLLASEIHSSSRGITALLGVVAWASQTMTTLSHPPPAEYTSVLTVMQFKATGPLSHWSTSEMCYRSHCSMRGGTSGSVGV